MNAPVESRPPVVWRLDPWQPALLFLVAAGLLGYGLYGSPSAPVRAITLGLGAAFVLAGFAALRMYVVADDIGIGVRRYFAETAVEWHDVTGIAVGKVRGGSMTLEVQREEGAGIVLPPSLLLPLRPTSTAKTSAMLRERAAELRNRRPAGS